MINNIFKIYENYYAFYNNCDRIHLGYKLHMDDYNQKISYNNKYIYYNISCIIDKEIYI